MSILDEAKQMIDKLVFHRRYLHENAEQHLDLPLTSAYVEKKLQEMGYTTKRLGSSGITATTSGNFPDRVFLLRADMDALPIFEENHLEYRCKTGSMHACGHDFHTSMLLGAARLLMNHRNEINGRVKLMFQPAEETLSGAQMMVDNGVLDNPKVDAAMMLHVTPGYPAGKVIIQRPGIMMAASDCFRIVVQGKGSHGAMPDAGVDPLNVISHIHIALQSINAREVSPADTLAITVGQMHGGEASNVIPDTAIMSGTIRTTDNEIREFAKKRLIEISQSIGETFRAQVEVYYEGGCPCLYLDPDVTGKAKSYAYELFGESGVVDLSSTSTKHKAMGSEDFACIAKLVPSTCVMLGVGDSKDGYHFPLHHPRVTFDEKALPYGAAVYANTAMRWIQDH